MGEGGGEERGLAVQRRLETRIKVLISKRGGGKRTSISRSSSSLSITNYISNRKGGKGEGKRTTPHRLGILKKEKTPHHFLFL